MATKKKDKHERHHGEARSSQAEAGPPAKMKTKEYEREMRLLHGELVAMQEWVKATGAKVCVLFEGRDTAGKGGTIKAITERVSPRTFRVIALPAPTPREKSQMYLQRYVERFPAGGEVVIFDRSWYNRAGVEPVMGFCTPEQTAHFLEEAPRFEQMIVNEGIHLFKFWLSIGREMQLKRFHDRHHDPLKVWKLSPVDMEALPRWDAYTKARNIMLEKTDTKYAPWTTLRANDKRRTRINIIRTVLNGLSFIGKDPHAIGEVDRKIVLTAKEFLAEHIAG